MRVWGRGRFHVCVCVFVCVCVVVDAEEKGEREHGDRGPAVARLRCASVPLSLSAPLASRCPAGLRASSASFGCVEVANPPLVATRRGENDGEERDGRHHVLPLPSPLSLSLFSSSSVSVSFAPESHYAPFSLSLSPPLSAHPLTVGISRRGLCPLPLLDMPCVRAHVRRLNETEGGRGEGEGGRRIAPPPVEEVERRGRKEQEKQRESGSVAHVGIKGQVPADEARFFLGHNAARSRTASSASCACALPWLPREERDQQAGHRTPTRAHTFTHRPEVIHPC